LKAHKIKLYLLEKELIRPFTTSFGTTKKRKIVLTRIFFDDGVEAWGECVAGNGPWYSYETYKTCWYIVKNYLSKLILNREIKHPREVSSLLEAVRGHEMAKYSVEAPFYAAYAEIMGKPLYKILNGVREKIMSGVSIGIKKSIRELIETIEKHLDEGYKRIKIKIKPGWDIKPLKAIRDIFNDIKLQVDANSSYTLKHLETLKKLDEFDLLMIEQPLHYKDLAEHAELQKKLKTPICLDESITSYHAAIAAIKLGSCKIINIKPGRVGGIRESLKIHEVAAQRDIGVWIGGMLETGIGRAYLVALATLPHINYPNDISASNRYWNKDVVIPEFKLNKDGTINVPNKPGLGIDLDLDSIDKSTIKTLTIKKN